MEDDSAKRTSVPYGDEDDVLKPCTGSHALLRLAKCLKEPTLLHGPHKPYWETLQAAGG